MQLIDESKVVFGNDTDEDDLYISPTIMTNIERTDDIMKQENEIFGPLLPILQIDSVQDAIDFVNAGYVYSFV